MHAYLISPCKMHALLNSPCKLQAYLISPCKMHALLNSPCKMHALLNSPCKMHAYLNSPCSFSRSKMFQSRKLLKAHKGRFQMKESWKLYKIDKYVSLLCTKCSASKLLINVRYTIIIIHGLPTSFLVTSAGHGYWRLRRRSMFWFLMGVEFCSFPLFVLIYRWRLQSSFS